MGAEAIWDRVGQAHVFGITFTPGRKQLYKWDGMENHLHYSIIFHVHFYQSYKADDSDRSSGSRERSEQEVFLFSLHR